MYCELLVFLKYAHACVHMNITALTAYLFAKKIIIISNFRLPTPRPGEVLGLVGTNGIGKSTALKILAGKQKPNLGRFNVSTVMCCNLMIKIVYMFYFYW